MEATGLERTLWLVKILAVIRHFCQINHTKHQELEVSVHNYQPQNLVLFSSFFFFLFFFFCF